MLFEQDNKLCKQDIKSFEQHIKLNNKTHMSLPGFRNLGYVLTTRLVAFN